MATDFGRYLDEAHDLAGTLGQVVTLLTGLERRLGPSLLT